MSIYDDLGEKYDSMIRWKSRLERETPFLQRLFSENRIQRVLDLGCGTGHHVRMFHNWGCTVVGYDASSSLLEVAKQQAPPDDESVSYVQGGFAEIEENVEGPFDAILSLGNSIPHVRNRSELDALFGAVQGLLRPGGVFVFQNRNYDRLLRTKERFHFPATHRSADVEQLYFRFNDFEDEHTVRFNIVHFRRVGESQGWLHEVFSTELTPWKRDDMKDAMSAAGFVGTDFYGDFSGTPFDVETSQDLVGLARKPMGSRAGNGESTSV